MFNNFKAMGIVASNIASQSSQATVFSYSDLAANSSSGAAGDQLSSVSSTYNDTTARFTWDAPATGDINGIGFDDKIGAWAGGIGFQ